MRITFNFSLITILVFLVISNVFAQKRKYPPQFYLVGEGYAEDQNKPEDISLAKDRAMADLANQIQASVKSEFINEVSETSNSLSEYASSKVKVISDMKIEGVRYEVNKDEYGIVARAILNKDETADLYFQKTKKLQKEHKL